MLTRIDKRTLIKRVLIVGFCAALISVVLGLLFVHKVRVAYEQKIMADMQADTQVLANSFDLKSTAMQSSLRSMAAQDFLLDSSISQEEKLAILNRFADRNGLVRAGYVTLDGKAFTSDNGTFDARDREWFDKAKAGCPAVSSNLYDRLGTNSDIIVFAEPVWRNDDVVSVVFAIQYTAEYLNTTQMNLLEKVNRVFVFDKEGAILAGAEKEQGTYDFFTLVKRNTPSKNYHAFKTAIENKKSSITMLVLDGKEYATAYAPIKRHEGWNVLLTLDDVELKQQSAMIVAPLYNWIALLSVLIAVVSGLLVWAFLAWRAERRENEKLLNKNDLLPQVQGIKSVNSLLRDIDRYYGEMPAEELAVVGVIIINSLEKYEKVLGKKQLTNLRIELAHKNSLLSNNACKIAYAGLDKYVIFATGFYSRQECRDYLMKIQAAMTESYDYGGFVIRLESVAGAKIYFKNDEYAKHPNRLLESAEYAQIEAVKQDRKIFFQDYELQSKQIMQKSLHQDFPMALKRDEFCIVYQPQYGAKSQKLVGFDAQLRWNHPEYGIIYPSEFIPMALECGFIIPIGHWLIEHVAQDAKELASPEIPISFKVLSLELLADDFADFVIEQITRNALPPHSLIINLSDNTVPAVYQQALSTIERLKSAGIDFALDYFGWWLKDVGYLSTLPISSIKISRNSFCNAGTVSDGCAKILKGIVDIADKDGVGVLIKGVKSENQKNNIEALGVDAIQGDYCGRPLTLLNAKKLLQGESGFINQREGGNDASH